MLLAEAPAWRLQVWRIAIYKTYGLCTGHAWVWLRAAPELLPGAPRAGLLQFRVWNDTQ